MELVPSISGMGSGWSYLGLLLQIDLKKQVSWSSWPSSNNLCHFPPGVVIAKALHHKPHVQLLERMVPECKLFRSIINYIISILRVLSSALYIHIYIYILIIWRVLSINIYIYIVHQEPPLAGMIRSKGILFPWNCAATKFVDLICKRFAMILRKPCKLNDTFVLYIYIIYIYPIQHFMQILQLDYLQSTFDSTLWPVMLHLLAIAYVEAPAVENNSYWR